MNDPSYGGAVSPRGAFIDYKSIFLSKTFWGALVAIAGAFYAPLTGQDAQATLVDQILVLAGSILAIIGRFTATSRVTLTGKPPKHLVWLLALVLIIPASTGCAAFRSQNPALPAGMVTELNFSNQLLQLQSDYENFFTHVGQAQRDGVLTQANVDQLNAVGVKLEKVLEHGNAAFKSWEANKGDDALKQAVISAISEGTQLFIELTAQQRALVRAKSGGAH